MQKSKTQTINCKTKSTTRWTWLWTNSLWVKRLQKLLSKTEVLTLISALLYLTALINFEPSIVCTLSYTNEQINKLRLLHSTLIEKDIWIQGLKFRWWFKSEFLLILFSLEKVSPDRSVTEFKKPVTPEKTIDLKAKRREIHKAPKKRPNKK